MSSRINTQAQTRILGVWSVEDKTISVTRQDNHLKYSQDDIICRIFQDSHFEYSDFLRTPEKPRDEKSSDSEEKKIEIRNKKDQYERELSILREKRHIRSKDLMHIFSSIIQENIQDCIRHNGHLQDPKSFLNFLPVIEKQGYRETEETEGTVSIFKPIENVNVALFGMFDAVKKTMIFARWGVFNRSTREVHSIAVSQDSEDTFKFLKWFCYTKNIQKREEFSKRFKPIIEMDGNRISNIKLHCFTELEEEYSWGKRESKIVSDQLGYVTVISKPSTASGYNTGHAQIWYEYVDFESFKHVISVAHITNLDEKGRIIGGLLGTVKGLARVAITDNPRKDTILRQGPTWVRPIEDVKRLDDSLRDFSGDQQYVAFNLLGDQAGNAAGVAAILGLMIHPYVGVASSALLVSAKVYDSYNERKKTYNCALWVFEQLKIANIQLPSFDSHPPPIPSPIQIADNTITPEKIITYCETHNPDKVNVPLEERLVIAQLNINVSTQFQAQLRRDNLEKASIGLSNQFKGLLEDGLLYEATSFLERYRMFREYPQKIKDVIEDLIQDIPNASEEICTNAWKLLKREVSDKSYPDIFPLQSEDCPLFSEDGTPQIIISEMVELLQTKVYKGIVIELDKRHLSLKIPKGEYIPLERGKVLWDTKEPHRMNPKAFKEKLIQIIAPVLAKLWIEEINLKTEEYFPNLSCSEYRSTQEYGKHFYNLHTST